MDHLLHVDVELTLKKELFTGSFGFNITIVKFHRLWAIFMNTMCLDVFWKPSVIYSVRHLMYYAPCRLCPISKTV